MIERFPLEIVGSQFGGIDRGINRRKASQNDHFGGWPMFFYLGQKLQAVRVRQSPVEQHNVRLRPGKKLVELLAVASFGNLVIFLCEDRA
jgi:hypothetical protein